MQIIDTHTENQEDQKIREDVNAELIAYNEMVMPEYNRLIDAVRRKRKRREDYRPEQAAVHAFARVCAQMRESIVKPLLELERRRPLQITMIPETDEDRLFLDIMCPPSTDKPKQTTNLNN